MKKHRGKHLGESIDFYVAMNMDGISELNDLAGGVTVTLEDDFSSIDPAMTRGTTLTLHGEQAETFVRSRMTVGDGTNASRMERQSVYAGGAVSDHRRTQSGRGWLHGVLSGCRFHPAGRAGAVLGTCGNELK